MKHLGILAHSTEGASLCFLAFCQEGARRLGAHIYPDITLDYIAFGHSMPAWEAGDHDSIRATLSVSADRLARAGADFFICPDNTAHMALERPGPDLALPGLHIAEVVADQAARDGRTRVGVLGTRYTMDGPLYPQALGARGIATELPAADDRLLINEIIFGELVNGVFAEKSRREHVRIINDLAARGCDAVALVCTEIPILLPPEASPLPILDSARLLASAALSVALEQRPMPAWRGGPDRRPALCNAAPVPSSRRLISSGSPLEPEIGFSRAVRSGPYVCVAGTAPIADDGGTAAPGDVYAQSVRCLDIAEQALLEAGSSLADVVRTRVMLTDIGQWREASRAHAQRFAQVRPACTFIEVSRFVDPEWLVEFEVDAIISD